MRIQVVEVVESNRKLTEDYVTRVVARWLPFNGQNTSSVQDGVLSIYSKEPIEFSSGQELEGGLVMSAYKYQEKFYNSLVFYPQWQQ